eukprot:Blabericola_migrator_1__8215@NODE_4251_length_1258_cov_5_057935_g2629_i0_p1_GENE_NODE_4251_length_1258_cov_5_057935_g2629_i0NODE_4251_length_1258_cov_5_057935_g2629_i0_p1_ORF_typecomplete_len145_score13_86TPT/PF03151_16/0_029_NODE_4251_length_1258_cov_5_057935_g2629_i06571091
MTVTKMTSALLKALLHALRAGVIWLLELALHWNHFDWLNFSGLTVLVIGFAIFGGMKIKGVPTNILQFMDKEVRSSRRLKYWLGVSQSIDGHFETTPYVHVVPRRTLVDKIDFKGRPTPGTQVGGPSSVASGSDLPQLSSYESS